VLGAGARLLRTSVLRAPTTVAHPQPCAVGAGAVPALLNVVHHMRGPAQRNAALALARVVKREENLALLKALHGLDILNSYLKL